MAQLERVVLSPRATNWLNKGRKRKVNLVEWKDNQRKVLRQSGNAYTNRKNQNKAAKAEPETERICRCNRAGCAQISFEQKMNLFTKFYNMTHSEQNAFLSQSCIELGEIKRHTAPEDISRRHCTFKYFVNCNNSGKLPICQKMLCSVFRVTPRRIQIIQEKIKNNESTEDKRGKHLNRPHRTSENTIVLIKDHIKLFPAQGSHYSRGNNSKLCLSPDLNIQKMFTMFKEAHPTTKVQFHTYRETFKSEFNLRFGLPRSDTCAKCDLLYSQLVNAETYNFCVHNNASGDATMHLWYETTANRGSAEIASCILSYVLDNFEVLEKRFCRSLIIWSDRCVGQNNNFKMLTLLQHLVLWKYFTQVEQKFLCSGHSFLPCDRNYAQIEKKKKTVRILHPFEWVQLIVSARCSKPFLVKLMTQQHFRDISLLEKNNSRPKDFKITEAMWLLMKQDDPKSVHVRKTHSTLSPWSVYTITKKKVPPINISALPLLYQSDKKANLTDMAKYIENQEAKNFYLTLPCEAKYQ